MSESRLWVPVLEDYIDRANQNMYPEEFVVRVPMKLFELVSQGIMPDLGAAQEYFHETRHRVQAAAAVQSVAARLLFDQFPPEAIGVVCPITNEPKDYGLLISNGHDASDLGLYLNEQRQNHEQNVRNLRENTGVFTLSR